MNTTHLIIVVPCYNEESVLPETIRQLSGVLNRMLENGKIVESGTHEELLAKKGSYAKLFEVQSRYYREGQENGQGSRNEHPENVELLHFPVFPVSVNEIYHRARSVECGIGFVYQQLFVCGNSGSASGKAV